MGAAENESFRDFVSREQAGLLRLAILLAGDRGNAEDLVQIALVKTYRRWARLSRSGTPSAYVRRALVSSHTGRLRRLTRTEQVMEGRPEWAEDDEELRRALRALPPRMRAALVLRLYEDLSEQRTAELMGCSAGTVNTQASRGLSRLRAALDAPSLRFVVREEQG